MVAMVSREQVVCPKCKQVLALWDNDADEWEPLGARIKRRDTDRGRSSFRCRICGAHQRIPDSHAQVADTDDAA